MTLLPHHLTASGVISERKKCSVQWILPFLLCHSGLTLPGTPSLLYLYSSPPGPLWLRAMAWHRNILCLLKACSSLALSIEVSEILPNAIPLHQSPPGSNIGPQLQGARSISECQLALEVPAECCCHLLGVTAQKTLRGTHFPSCSGETAVIVVCCIPLA